jgi:hypothetical protein
MTRIATHSFDLVVFLSGTAAGFDALQSYVEASSSSEEAGFLAVSFFVSMQAEHVLMILFLYSPWARLFH